MVIIGMDMTYWAVTMHLLQSLLEKDMTAYIFKMYRVSAQYIIYLPNMEKRTNDITSKYFCEFKNFSTEIIFYD